MLTFDDLRTTPEDPLKELLEKNTPDKIEIGENNEYWLYVRRSTKQVELVSKVTGLTTAKCNVEYVAKYGLITADPPIRITLAQISAAQAGLVL